MRSRKRLRCSFLESLVPDVLRHQLRRELLGAQDVRVHADHEDLLVVRAIEDADVAALGQAAYAAPQEVVVELLPGRPLEGPHVDTLRIDSRHDVLDRAVLAGGVHGLEDQQDGPAVLRVETLLQLGQSLDAACEQLGGLVFELRLEPAGDPGVHFIEAELGPVGDPERLHEIRDFQHARWVPPERRARRISRSRRPKIAMPSGPNVGPTCTAFAPFEMARETS